MAGDLQRNIDNPVMASAHFHLRQYEQRQDQSKLKTTNSPAKEDEYEFSEEGTSFHL
jgi:hypothetical protein